MWNFGKWFSTCVRNSGNNRRTTFGIWRIFTGESDAKFYDGIISFLTKKYFYLHCYII